MFIWQNEAKFNRFSSNDPRAVAGGRDDGAGSHQAAIASTSPCADAMRQTRRPNNTIAATGISRPSAAAGDAKRQRQAPDHLDHAEVGAYRLLGRGVPAASERCSRRAFDGVRGCRWFHPPANVDKMHRGIPLNEDRQPWLAAIAGWIDNTRRSGGHAVIACSALKRRYRDVLVGSRADVRLVYLKGDETLIARRIATRSGFGSSWPGVASMLNASPVPARRQGKVRAAAYLRAPVMDASLFEIENRPANARCGPAHQDADGGRRKRFR